MGVSRGIRGQDEVHFLSVGHIGFFQRQQLWHFLGCFVLIFLFFVCFFGFVFPLQIFSAEVRECKISGWSLI